MTDHDSFLAGRNGFSPGAATDMEAYRHGQTARRIDLENQESVNRRAPARTGPTGGGAALFGPLFALPFLVAMAVFAFLPAWLLAYTLPRPFGEPVPGYWTRYKTALFTAVACNALPTPVFVLGPRLSPGELAGLYAISLPIAAVVMKMQLPRHFPGFPGYIRACLVALLTSLIANLLLAMAGFAIWRPWLSDIDAFWRPPEP